MTSCPGSTPATGGDSRCSAAACPIREHFWFTTQPIEEPADPAHPETALRHIGMNDRIMFASDYPHWDFDSPRMAPRLLFAAIREQVMGANACRLFGLPQRAQEA